MIDRHSILSIAQTAILGVSPGCPMANPFVHLHCHTDYSLLDGACEISQLMKLAAKQKMPSVAMTDHGNMFGAIDFYRKAKDAGIKPE